MCRCTRRRDVSLPVGLQVVAHGRVLADDATQLLRPLRVDLKDVLGIGSREGSDLQSSAAVSQVSHDLPGSATPVVEDEVVHLLARARAAPVERRSEHGTQVTQTLSAAQAIVVDPQLSTRVCPRVSVQHGPEATRLHARDLPRVLEAGADGEEGRGANPWEALHNP